MYEYLRRPASETVPRASSLPSRRAAPRTDASHWAAPRTDATETTTTPETAQPLKSISIHAKELAGRKPEITPELFEELRERRDVGGALPGPVRRDMEPRFGHTFSGVRIHTDDKAAQMAHALGARAFTAGENIMFGVGEYRPSTLEGRGLIAHELTHVVQNRRGRAAGRGGGIEPVGSRAEKEANRAGAMAGLGLPAGPIGAANAGVALTPTSEKIIPLISYSWRSLDRVVTAEEEKKVLALLKADSDLSTTVIDLHKAGMLDELLSRVDERANRRELLRLFGAHLNDKARKLVEPDIQEMGTGWQAIYGLGRWVNFEGAPFNAGAYKDLVSSNPSAPFTGVGASGDTPGKDGIGFGELWKLHQEDKETTDKYTNPLTAEKGWTLDGYMATLSPENRKRQAKLLLLQPISSNFSFAYADKIPLRKEVIRGAAARYRLEPEFVAAIILAEQRDQSRREDAKDLIGAQMADANLSIGLGQVVVSTARKNDLFSDLLLDNKSLDFARSSVNHDLMALLLASDEFNIFAVAKYIRLVADMGSKKKIGDLPFTKSSYPSINMGAYAGHSSAWPDDNRRALASEYTSTPWDDRLVTGWGYFVLEAYKDVKAAKVF